MTELNQNINDTVDNSERFAGISSFTLHIIAMLIMLCDHMWATVLSNYGFLTSIGRIAFPIFAFTTVEGYFHTHDIKKYFKRLFIFAIISEIPFNLMYVGSTIYPFHQNVIWTFIIALFCINTIERVKKKNKLILTVIVGFIMTFVGYLLGIIFMVDYFGYGVLTVLAFYFFRGNKWYNRLGQLICMYWINCKLLAGLTFAFNIFGFDIIFPQQGIAMAALIPIWLYKGKQGPYNKYIKYSFYAFYPAHMLILALIGLYL